MANINLIRVAVGLESTPGTVVPRLYRLPVTGNPALDTEVTKERDPAINAENMPSGFYTTRLLSGGAVPLSFRPSPGCILSAYSALGGTTPVGNGVQIGAVIRLRYTGAQASCKISANTSGDTLTSEIGDFGAESGDAAFGTSGDIDLQNAGFDTVGELVAAIDAYANYECQKLMGADSVDAADIIDIVAEQGKDRWVYIFFSSSTSGVYLYTISAHLGQTERPTLSAQVDERPSNEVYSGAVGNMLALEAALQGFLSGTLTLQAFEEFVDTTATANTASGDATISEVDTRKLIPGMTVSGTGIPAGATISSITTVGEEGSFELSANATANGTGVTLTFGIPDIAIALEDIDPMVFWKGSTTLKATEYPFVNNITVQIGNNGREDTYGQGKASRQYNQKGQLDLAGTLQIPLDAAAYANRASIFSGLRVGISFYFYGKVIAESLKEMIIVDAPYCELMNMERPESGGQLDAKYSWTAIAPKGGYYGSPARLHFITSEVMS
ncbi:MAG: hypothetical protein IT186_14045 [Acidobacteria bacterium]|nr:hypothetical protein [Acidobacteriota bacterium]